MTGRIQSIQTLGTVDGPGVRFVAFLQGCPLRCKCCHNPDTWALDGGQEYTPGELAEKVARYRAYFGERGGITLSGGEPLLQAVFAREVFTLCRELGIHTCLDTAGCVWNGEVARLLEVTDRVLLDVKYTTEEAYREYVGGSLQGVLAFLDELNRRQIPTTLRQVIIPTVNDTQENVLALKAIAAAHPCVDGVELLPFRKICQVKYDELGLQFPFGDKAEPTADLMDTLRQLLQKEDA